MKLRLKITLVMLCLLAALFGAGGSALISISFTTAFEQEKEAALDSYQMTLNTLSMVIQIEEWDSSADVSKALELLEAQDALGLQALRLSAGDAVLFESGSQTGLLQQMEGVPEPNQCLYATFEQEGSHSLQVLGSLQVADEELHLQAAYDLSPVYAARAELQGIFSRVFLIMVPVCALLAYVTTWLLTRPLMRLSKASKELARGNLSYRAPVRSSDEIGALARDFNAMASKIERGVASLQSTMAHQERFMAGFAHELKTPMTSIVGYAELLQGQALTPEEQMDAAHYIFSEGKRLESLSFKLLEILADEQSHLEMQRVSPAALIGKLVASLRPVYEKEHIALTYQASGGSCLMEPDLVVSLLINLMDNARKALEGGGTISVESKVSRGRCIISVRDNGKGIPEEALMHLTEAFYRVDTSRAREQGGVGLGLTLCAKIVELHGGTLQFESSEGEGTCVTVVLKAGRA